LNFNSEVNLCDDPICAGKGLKGLWPTKAVKPWTWTCDSAVGIPKPDYCVSQQVKHVLIIIYLALLEVSSVCYVMLLKINL